MNLLFDTSDFPARWYCGQWTSLHGWTHIVADVAIFGAYVAIPFALGYFVRRRTDVPFPKLFWLFSAFILCCGFSHLVEASIFWRPWYRVSAVVKVATAIVSWATVIAVWPVIPVALRFKSPAALEGEVTQRTEQLADANTLLNSKNSELEQFIYSMSHDLRSPLVTARGFLGVLKEDLEPVSNEAVTDSIDRIDRATLRMGEMLDKLLELSRIGKTQDVPEWTDVERLISDLAGDLEPVPEYAGHQVVIEGTLPAAFTDPGRLRQIFENLVRNAVKYGTTEASPHVTISGRETNAICEYQIRDHGRGIPDDQKQNIFLPFERLAADAKGVGIGLSIVAKLVSVMGGTVIVEDTPGGGATFVVSLPRKEWPRP